MQGNFTAALAAFDRLPRQIDDPEVASNIGTTCFFLGKLDEAEENFKLALRLRPSEAFHANLGDVYARRGDVAAAQRKYGRAADMLAAETPDHHDRRAARRSLFLAKAGRCAEALPLASTVGAKGELSASQTANLAKASPPAAEGNRPRSARGRRAGLPASRWRAARRSSARSPPTRVSAKLVAPRRWRATP